MNDQQQNSKISSTTRTRGRYMDMAARGSSKMSPEMIAAQRRLQHKSADSRPPRPRVRPQQGPMTASRVRRPNDTAQVKTRVRTAPVQPTGPSDSLLELETIEFEAIGDLAAMDTTEELAESFIAEPTALNPLETPRTPNSSTARPAPRTARNPRSPQARARSAQKLNETAAATPEKLDEAPDANKYTLGGKSPFINTLNLDKRPLSGHSVTKKPAAPVQPSSTRLTTSDTIPTVVASKKKSRKSNIALGIAVVLTVILGAVVGTFVYLAFFQ